MKFKKWGAVLIVLALVASAVLLVRARKASLAAAPTPTARPTLVRVVAAKVGSLEEVCTYLGRFEPWQNAELAAQVNARVLTVSHREGDRVRRGELLVQLDDAELRSSLGQSEATLASLDKSLDYWEQEEERDRTLAVAGAIPQATADATADRLSEIRGRVDAQRQQVLQMQARLAYARINSPFDGVVTHRDVDPGDLAAPGRVLLAVEDCTRQRLCFDVPQNDLDKVRLGSVVEIDASGEPLKLRVTRLHPALNSDRTRTVEADITGDSNLPSGAYLPVRVVKQRLENAVLIPEAALLTGPDGKRAVFTVIDGVTHLVPVQISLRSDGLAAVTGLAPETAVVLSTYLGWNRLAAGERVEVRQ